MKKIYELNKLDWQLAGYTPFTWQQEQTHELGISPNADIPSIPAPVPGSVQMALRQQDILPDWNMGLKSRDCEWVEHRHWVYSVVLPDEWITGEPCRLRCLGLDYAGEIRLNGKTVYEFANGFISHSIELSDFEEKDNLLQIVFTFSPQWLGTPARTSEIKEWKSRFNYTWDWMPRIVQIGIWDDVTLETTITEEFSDLHIIGDWDIEKETGILALKGDVSGASDNQVKLSLSQSDKVIREETVSTDAFSAGVDWQDLAVDAWWPNTYGDQPLYELTTTLLNSSGDVLDTDQRQVGFKHVEWRPCDKQVSKEADPWICVVNGTPVFLKGVNWSPIRPNYADVPESEYRRRLELYKELNMNCFRVNGVGILEKECYYRICDELGLLNWQEFTLSCGGLDNDPPRDAETVASVAEWAGDYVKRRRHHVSLFQWGLGNELLEGDSKAHQPITKEHPMYVGVNKVMQKLDPSRRFMQGSATGPTFYAGTGNRDSGTHWDVHGPWEVMNCPVDEWEETYWVGDDALFRSEVGAPGPSSVELIRKYIGDQKEYPCNMDNPMWRRTSWWIQWPVFVKEMGREPKDLEEMVEWGQAHQAEALRIAAKTCRDRFPEIGGILFWHGHDSFPCLTNTAMIDFDGNPKPAALAVGEVFAKDV
ncbi:MAG: hypothetical protein HRT89_04440 [Lentisphaeria bacterium]|nr:hypothetical protein [Lentisphaeria bacterium]NQZ67295.1 hypothetical protein [Lentisphaeria bacterium]